MTNHFHLLVRTEEMPLASAMRRLMTSHAVRFNLRHKRKGHLFQNRYKSIVVEEESYFLELVRYIHLNPVRAGLALDAEELEKYPFSGHSVLIGNRNYAAQDVASVLDRFSGGGLTEAQSYRNFVAEGFCQGVREELRGGGLMRSAGEGARFRRETEERIAADRRILGAGDFVEQVLRECDMVAVGNRPDVDQILDEVVTRSGVGREQILGPGRSRSISSARREFFLRAREEAGVTLTTLGNISGRSHVAVHLAIEQARLERGSKPGNG